MTIKTSTGLANKMLDTGSLKSILNLGFINIYSGSAPATADDAVTGTLLCVISNNATGTGLTMAASAASRVLTKNGSEVWKGTNIATGTAGYYRHVGASDTGASSTTEPRIQGDCGVLGSDLNLTAGTSLVATVDTPVANYSVNLPTF